MPKNFYIFATFLSSAAYVIKLSVKAPLISLIIHPCTKSQKGAPHWQHASLEILKILKMLNYFEIANEEIRNI